MFLPPLLRHGSSIVPFRGGVVEPSSATRGTIFGDCSTSTAPASRTTLSIRLTESRRALERDLTEALQGLVTSAETALAEARRAHANGTAGVRERLNVIETLRRRLEEVCARGHEGVDGPLA